MASKVIINNAKQFASYADENHQTKVSYFPTYKISIVRFDWCNSSASYFGRPPCRANQFKYYFSLQNLYKIIRRLLTKWKLFNSTTLVTSLLSHHSYHVSLKDKAYIYAESYTPMQVTSLIFVKHSIKKKLLHYLAVIQDVNAGEYLIQFLKHTGEKPSVLKKRTSTWLLKIIIENIGTVSVNTQGQYVLKENMDTNLDMLHSYLLTFPWFDFLLFLLNMRFQSLTVFDYFFI